MTPPETVRIILPLPHRSLSPNHPSITRGGRIQKARETKKYRERAMAAVLACGVESGPWEFAKVSAVFYHKANRRRDQDNAMASIKAAYDGLRDAGLIVDDDFEHLRRESPTFAIDRECPRVELTVTRIQ